MEEFLERKYLFRFMKSQFNIAKVVKELFGGKSTIEKIVGTELKSVRELRCEIRSKLGGEGPKVGEVAEMWSLYLKSKVSSLKFWSGFSTSMVAFIGLGILTARFIFSIFESTNPAALVFAFIVFSVVILLFKSFLEQKIAWVEFLCGHLEAIDKISKRDK